jgi:hypothetical protein
LQQLSYADLKSEIQDSARFEPDLWKEDNLLLSYGFARHKNKKLALRKTGAKPCWVTVSIRLLIIPPRSDPDGRYPKRNYLEFTSTPRQTSKTC